MSDHDIGSTATIDRLTAGTSDEMPAVVSATATLSYREFDTAVNSLAHALCARGIGHDDCVGVIIPRSPELVVAVHAVLRAGAAYVPVDPQHPAIRIRTILEDSDVRAVIAGPEFTDTLADLGIDRVPPSVEPVGFVEPTATPDDLAYIIYTSGSTGRPKGVMIEHRSVTNRLRWMQHRYPLSRRDVILQKTPATFDVSVWELLWWAMAGASVAVLEPGGERDPRTIIAAVERHRVTVMHFVPSSLGPFLDEITDHPGSLQRLASLRTVFCSGEALTPALVERFNRVFDSTGVPRLVNLYGPTEATVDVSCFDCPSSGPVDVVPIGKPIDNTTLLVLDEQENPCPVGVPGELNIAGVGLARGYRGRDDLTATKFLADRRVPGGRRYRTGDLARWRADGNLEFLGRIDDEIKVRGNRVSLGELRAVMESCPGVRSAVAIAESSGEAGVRLTGYYIGDSVSVDELRAHLTQRLPAAVIPSGFCAVEAFPLTASGKMDRRALPRPDSPDRSATAPRTRAETVLADVFASVLGLESVGVHDDFFTIGGDSILAIAVRSEAEKRGVTVDVEELFARPTVAELAGSASCHEPEMHALREPFATLSTDDRRALHDAQDAFPATTLQLGMLFHSLESGGSRYKDVFRYRISMPWRDSEFRGAFDQLVARHPALRSSFDLTECSVPVQVVRAQVPRAFDVETDTDDVTVREYITSRHTQHYDVDTGPLYWLRAFVRDEGVDLVFSFHHAVLDGWSVANLISDLVRDYLRRVGFDVPPVDGEVQSAAVLAEYARLESAAAEDTAAQDFWRRALAGSHPTTLPPGGVDTRSTDVVATEVVPEGVLDSLRRLAKRQGWPLKSALVAAHGVTLQKLTGRRDVTTGLVTHGRPGRAGAEAAAGLFLNTLPFRLGSEDRTWRDAIEHATEFERTSHRYRRYPLHAMQSDAGRVLLTTAFTFVNYHPLAELARIPGIELVDVEVHEQTNFSLLATAGVDPRTQRMFVRVTGDPQSVSTAQVREYADSFIAALMAIARAPDESIGTDTDGSPTPYATAEAVLATAFASTLGVESVGVHDDFFTIGGDSILALLVRSRAEKRGISFDIEDLYATPTVAALARSASRPARERLGVTEPFALLPLIDRAALNDAEDAFPANTLQLGMLFHSIERVDSTMYKDVFRYRLELPWREEQFTAAFDRMVDRHPALRSCFELTRHSVPVQVVRSRVPRAFDAVTGATDADIDRYMTARQAQRYDFGTAPLYSLRAYVGEEWLDLVFAFHHALLDGWSAANLLREVVQDYLHDLGDDIAAIDSAVHSTTLLAEHVRLEREVIDDPVAREFWRDAMAGSRATTLGSYVAHEKPVAADPHVAVQLPEWLQNSAVRLAQSRGVPLKSLLLAAHCVTLQRLSGDTDVTTGLVTHGRPGRTGAELAAGLFLNTIPIRLDASPRTWMEVVDHLVGFERASHRYRRYPLQIMQSDAGRPLFTTVFDFLDYHLFGDVDSAAGARLLDYEARERTNYPLWVTAAADPRTGRLSLRVTGDRVALTTLQASEFGHGFVRALAAIVRDPDGLCDPWAEEIAARDVVQLISERAASHPQESAVVTDAGTWTYQALDRGAERIAAGLLSAGMPAGARVGVMLERSPELIATVLGVLKAGAAVVPLDVSYPRARLDLMIERAQPFRVISDLAQVRELLGAAASTALPAIDPGSAAYVLFTSGSTGEPKGVAMPHRALQNVVEWQNRRASGVVGGTTLQFFPLSFDVAFQEIFSTLCGGGTLRLVSEPQRHDLSAVVRLVAKEEVNRVFLTCVALQAFAEAALVSRTRLPSLHAVINVGEQLRISTQIRRMCTQHPGLVLENQYGPTETHEVASYTLLGAPDEFPTLPPIGTAIDGATIRLLDPRRRPVPPGTPGEIYVGGRCLALGYEGRPDLTAERFVTVGEPGERMYRTGDLAVQLPTGDLVYLGRADTQVKVRGFRVECAEVELALMRLGDRGVHAAAVVAKDLDARDVTLVAYLLGDRNGVDLAAVRTRLRQVLPAYMVPMHYRWLDEFPLTPSGKRDDKALRELPLVEVATSPLVDTSSDARQSAVAEIMAEFAGAPAFAADTNFFEAGGTSIGAMRVVLAIARLWEIEIPLDAFVSAPTPAGIAALIAGGTPERVFDPVVPLRSSGDRPPLFLVHPIGGNVLCYLDLAEHLPAEQPVYALQAAGAEPGAAPLRTVGDLAASYVAAMRTVCPQGPYLVGGWSFGGYVAVEMARQLADEEVARLVLLDTTALRDGPRAEVTESELITWFFGELILESLGMDALRNTPDFDGADRGALFDHALRYAVEAGIVPAGGSRLLIRRLYEIFRANYRATLEYHHAPLDRDIVLLKSIDGLPQELTGPHRAVGSMFASPTNGWERLSPRSLRVVPVRGDHLSMMSEPCVADVAAKLAVECGQLVGGAGRSGGSRR